MLFLCVKMRRMHYMMRTILRIKKTEQDYMNEVVTCS